MPKPPLHLRILFHPKSHEAFEVAQQLLNRFVEPPASNGIRIPTFFGPDNGDHLPPPTAGEQKLDLDIAEHSIVVVLSDKQMVRDVTLEDSGKQWLQFAAEMTSAVDKANDQHYFFAAALDEVGFGIADDQNVIRSIGSVEEQVNAISTHISIAAIKLLRDDHLNELDSRGLKAPITLFLSHAKTDLSTTPRDPVRWVMDEGTELPVEHWFDSAAILPNENFSDRIGQGIRDASVVVVFLTDSFASRPWCRREVLEAKRMGLPILVVNALSNGEPRSFPYLGNVPTVRWNEDAVDEDQCRIKARSLIDRAIRESLRAIHNRAATKLHVGDGEVALATPPELASLANDFAQECLSKSGRATFVYPDPPLSSEELGLLSRVFPSADFSTPLSKIATDPLPESVRNIAVSISNVEESELRGHGLSRMHFEMMSDELHLYLLMAGAQIGYGGALRGSMTDANNFTVRLFELVRGYSSIARLASGEGLLPIINFAPWPLAEIYNEDDFNFMANVAKFAPGPTPDLHMSFDELFPKKGENDSRLKPMDALQRFGWSRGLTEMRQKVVQETSSRVSTGGKFDGMFGAIPGVLEEAWMSISEGKPLFVVGAYGGVSGGIVDLLEGRNVDKFSGKFSRDNIPNYDDVCKLYGDSETPFISSSQMASEIQSAAKEGISNALNNGLTDEENQELFRIVDPASTAELILTGIKRISETT